MSENDSRIDRIETRLEKHSDLLLDIHANLAEQGVHLNNYNDLLKEHVKRSESLEALVDELYRYKYYITGGIALCVPVLVTVLDLVKTWILK